MLLTGKRGLVLNVTNKNSIGWAVADLAAREGARVGVGAQNDKMLERVTELTDGREGMESLVVDFLDDAQLTALADEVRRRFGQIDFLVHSAAFAQREDLQGRFIETSRGGFQTALEVSAFSLVALCRALEPLLADDGSVVTMSYLGSTRAVGNYNVMGVAKAALESCVRYLAVDLGARGIRVNTVSPGPINTVAARGVRGLAEMIGYVHERAPLKRPFGQAEVASSTLYLLSDLSRGVTGQIIFVDDGYNIVGL
jgi:enoyl-[acyl-carrier protein] reductase I